MLWFETSLTRVWAIVEAGCGIGWPSLKWLDNAYPRLLPIVSQRAEPCSHPRQTQAHAPGVLAMPHQPRILRVLAALLAALAVGVFSLAVLLCPIANPAQALSQALSPSAALARAWQQAQAAGTYRLTSDVRQPRLPTP